LPSVLAIRVLELDDLTVVGLDGELHAESSPRVATVVADSLARDVSTIVVDCSLLDTIDAAASTALGRAAYSVRQHHGRLVVRQPSPETRAVLDLTGTSAVVEYGD